MTLAKGYLGGILGLGEEKTWGTAVTRTKFIRMNSDGIDVQEEHLNSKAIPAVYSDDDDFVQGPVRAGGPVEFEMRYEGCELIFKHGMGGAAVAEVATFEVTASNKYIDFKEDAGDALLATVAEGTVAMGESGATAGTLCAAIKTALEAAGAGTYTVTFSNTTKLITIAVSGGASAVQFLWKTGAHGSDNLDDHIGTLLGFSDAADGENGASDTGDSAVVTVFDHTFTLADALPTGLSVEVDRDTDAFLLEGAKIQNLNLSIEPGGFLMGSVDFVAEDMTNTTVTASTLTTGLLVSFAHGACTYNAGAKSIKNAKITLNNNLKVDRQFVGSRLIAEPQRQGRYEVTGSILVEFDGYTEYTDFRAGSSKAIVLTFTGATIKSGFTYTITITLAQVKLMGGVPKMKDGGPIEVEIPFKAYAASTSAREMTAVIRNTKSTI